jgi:hypothetical protein
MLLQSGVFEGLGLREVRMEQPSLISWLTIFCWVLLIVTTPFGGTLAQTQNPAAQRNSGAGTAPVSGDASAKNAAQVPKSAGQGGGQKLAEEQFKNIQALKGIPADQLIPAMQFITASLGVDCEFCHVHDKMDSDDKKPKKIARQMITMMFDIDKNNFDGRLEVTCYTCHRGAAKPVSIPAIKDDEMPAGPGAPGEKPLENAASPKPEELLDKYLAAVGGAAAVEKITSRVQKGKVLAFGGQSFPAEVYSKAPDKRASVMHLQDGDSVTAFDGQRGWLSVPGRPAHMMSASENESARLDADLHFPVHVKTLYSKFKVETGEKIDGHDTYLVEGHEDGRPPLRLCFDTQTGLLLRLVRYSHSPLGLNPTQIDFADYREVGGVKVPFRWTVSRPGNRFTIQVQEMKQNAPVDDSKFTPPPPPPAQPPGPPSGQKPQ